MTNNHVIFSWADCSRTLFSNMFYVLWLISHILWPVKRDHLIEYILVLVYCHSYDNNRLGTFRIVFFYTSMFYYPNHVFNNLSRITIHGCFIKLNMHRNNNIIKQCLIYIFAYNVLELELTLTQKASKSKAKRKKGGKERERRPNRVCRPIWRTKCWTNGH